MVKDQQLRRLRMLIRKEKTLAVAASKAGVDEKTARRYRRLGRLPSEVKPAHTWRTRKDPFEGVWPQIERLVEENPGLEGRTLLKWLQRTYPGKFADGQLRTLHRRLKVWRATKGPSREVYFAQVHRPGELGASDFTHMESLGVTIAGKAFDHLVFHFVLTYSNWETGTVCFSESFESLSDGLQNALWELGGVPKAHRTDQLSAAVERDLAGRTGFTQRYEAVLRHYGLSGQKTQPCSPNENGDAEQSHRRLKSAMDQALMLRFSRDFASRKDYEAFVRQVFEERNSGRRKRLDEELAVLGRLPERRLETAQRLRMKVGPSSTVRVAHNSYSVPSRLIGEEIEVRLHTDHLSIFYGGRCMEANIPRLRGEGRHAVNYRHVIDWLVRKPGAFANYRFRGDLFPTSRFRMAYDALAAQPGLRADKQYLRILELAARTNEAAVDEGLRALIDADERISFEAVEALVAQGQTPAPPREVVIDAVDLAGYDSLLVERRVAA
jgi:Mu transposase, C-terminal domain